MAEQNRVAHFSVQAEKDGYNEESDIPIAIPFHRTENSSARMDGLGLHGLVRALVANYESRWG